jgi:hypothetical protein
MVPINFIAVLLAALASFAIGWVWYSALFGKTWRRLAGLSLEDMKSMEMSPLGASIGGILTALLMAYVLAHGIEFGNAYLNTGGIEGGLQGAFWYWLGFAVPLTAGVYLWEGKSWKLWAINAGYYLVALLAMGAIIGAL